MRYKINLLPPREQSYLDRAVYFAFNYLRYILVITQIIVIGVFFFRFSIDQEIIDLKDNLNQKQEIVSVSSPLLSEVEKTESIISEIKLLIGRQKKSADMFTYLTSILPEGMTLQKFSMSEDGVSFNGDSSDINSVYSYYSRLKRDSNFKIIKMGDLKKKGSEFSFSFDLQQYIKK